MPFTFLSALILLMALTPKTDDKVLQGLDQIVPQLQKQHQVPGVGIGVIKSGRLVHTAYYGE